jgi:hypothetical protein
MIVAIQSATHKNKSPSNFKITKAKYFAKDLVFWG